MKNTALAELIHYINNKGELHKETLINKANSLLEKEKQDLIDAHYEGQKECSNEFAMESDARLYYNQTFKQ